MDTFGRKPNNLRSSFPLLEAPKYSKVFTGHSNMQQATSIKELPAM